MALISFFDDDDDDELAQNVVRMPSFFWGDDFGKPIKWFPCFYRCHPLPIPTLSRISHHATPRDTTQHQRDLVHQPC